MSQLLLAFFLVAPSANANYLTYVDENGTKHFVASESEVPEKFRAKTKISSVGDPKNSVPHKEKDDDKEAKPSTSAAQSSPPKQSSEQRSR